VGGEKKANNVDREPNAKPMQIDPKAQKNSGGFSGATGSQKNNHPSQRFKNSSRRRSDGKKKIEGIHWELEKKEDRRGDKQKKGA